MKSREKLLAAGAGVLVGGFVVFSVYNYVAGMFTEQAQHIAALNKTIVDKEAKIKRGDDAAKKIAVWNKRSLPTDAELARSQYQDWLSGLVAKVKIASADVQEISTQAVRRTGNEPFQRFTFKIKGETDLSLKPLVRFLYEFYTANHLQRISNLKLNLRPDGKRLTIDMDVVALSLPTAGRADALAQEKSNRLALTDLAAYEKAISERNLFAEYTPKANVASKPAPKAGVDPAKFAEVTGFTEQNDSPQLWVLEKTTGKLLKLKEGDEFTVGDLTCKVVRIGTRDAVLTTEGKTVQVKLGDNLRDATPVPADEL